MFRFNNFYYPTDAVDDRALTKQDTIDFLAEDDDKETLELDDKKDKSTKKGEESEDTDTEGEEEEESKSGTKKDEGDEDEEEKVELEDELEEELEEPDEEKLELMTPVRRREILTKYPKLFKDFPYLERAYYREQQFTEILPTIADAKLAVEKSETLDNFEKDLLSGNTRNVLKAVKEHDKKAFDKIADDYLVMLRDVDDNAYYHVIGNTMKSTIMAMVNESKASGNEALQSAAQILNQFVFGTSNFNPPSKLVSEEKKDDKEDKISERERAFTQRQFDTAKSDLSTRVENVLKSTIEANMDPKSAMTDYVKRVAVREANEQIQSLMDSDKRFGVILDKLWEEAFKKDFSKITIDRIKSAYLSKAKTLLPDVIKKARNEALKGLGKRVKDDSDSEESSKKGPIPVGRTTAPSKSMSGKSIKEQARAIPRGMSSKDFLMQD